MSASFSPEKTQVCVRAAVVSVLLSVKPSVACRYLGISHDKLHRIVTGTGPATWTDDLIWQAIALERCEIGTDTIAAAMTGSLATGQTGSRFEATAILHISDGLPDLIGAIQDMAEAIRDDHITAQERQAMLGAIPKARAHLDQVEADLRAATTANAQGNSP